MCTSKHSCQLSKWKRRGRTLPEMQLWQISLLLLLGAGRNERGDGTYRQARIEAKADIGPIDKLFLISSYGD